MTGCCSDCGGGGADDGSPCCSCYGTGCAPTRDQQQAAQPQPHPNPRAAQVGADQEADA